MLAIHTAAAYSAEDVIESHIVDQILAGSTKQTRSVDCNQERGDGEDETEELLLNIFSFDREEHGHSGLR